MNALPVPRPAHIERRRMPQLPDRLGLAGALAGLGGGLAMAIVAALLTRALDQELWLQLEAIASLVLGSAATEQAGFAAGPVLLGLLIHLAVAALLGTLFELLVRKAAWLPSEYGMPELLGLLSGPLIWLAAHFVVLPLVAPALLRIYAPALLIQHLVYGAVLGLIYAVLRPQAHSAA